MAVSRINEAGLNVNQYGNRNVIINGAMQVAQRGTSFTGLGGSTGAVYTLDRFNTFDSATAGRATVTQDTSAPNGFGNSLKIACTTADTSVAAGEAFMLTQRIEGQNLQQFAKGTSAAKEFTLSFYVKGNASATYVCELFHAGASRQISKTFSVTTDWTRVILTYPADTTSAFANDNTGVLYLQIFLHAGSNFTSGTLNSTSWASNTNANRAVGIDSFFDSTSRTFFITGVQLEVGDTATDFEHRSFGDELARCQRYYEKSFDYDTAPAQNTGGAVRGCLSVSGVSTSAQVLIGHVAFATEKRATPTLTSYNPYASGTGWSQAGSGNYTRGTYGIGTRAMSLRVDSAPGSSTTNILINWAVDAEL
tara:strand:+ start:199 stop:1293 length:1095 start_codon:yes stop_codon:yes gene_type:complete